MAKFTLNVNGQSHDVDVAPDTPLLWVLRDTLDLVGTKFGCGCLTPVSSVGASKVTTIEGLSADGSHPLQRAWIELDVAQCGYCQAGQIMTAAALLANNPHPTDQDIDGTMSGNLCRCATYTRRAAA